MALPCRVPSATGALVLGPVVARGRRPDPAQVPPVVSRECGGVCMNMRWGGGGGAVSPAEREPATLSAPLCPGADRIWNTQYGDEDGHHEVTRVRSER